MIEIAWRAQRRLHQRWQHLHDERRKPAGVVAIAVARELAAFLLGGRDTLTDPTPTIAPGMLPGRARATRRPTHRRAKARDADYGQPATDRPRPLLDSEPRRIPGLEVASPRISV